MKKGDKVVFLNERGSQFDRDEAVFFGLVEENVYTVDSIESGGFVDWVRFKENRGGACGFNVEMFQIIEPTASPQPKE